MQPKQFDLTQVQRMHLSLHGPRLKSSGGCPLCRVLLSVLAFGCLRSSGFGYNSAGAVQEQLCTIVVWASVKELELSDKETLLSTIICPCD